MLKRNFYIFELDENLNTIYQNVWDIAKGNERKNYSVKITYQKIPKVENQ